MSDVVLVSVGQCGNQIASSFAGSALSNGCGFGARRDGKLRLVMVDSEPKVIRQVREGQLGGAVAPHNVHFEQNGRGNNWAFGYDWGQAARLAEGAVESVRKEAEGSEGFEGTVLLHSLGGGTGAGLGSRVAEQLREEFPSSFLLSAAAVPFAQGTPLQSYNTVLTLAHLDAVTDGMMLFHNEDIVTALQRQNRAPGNKNVEAAEARLGFEDINRSIAHALAGVFFPIREGRCWTRGTLGGLVASTCPFHGAKLLEAWSACEAKVPASWATLVARTLKAVPRYNQGALPLTISARIVMRGDAKKTALKEVPAMMPKIHKALPTVKWNSELYSIHSSQALALPAEGLEASATACINRSYSAGVFRETLQRAQGMHEAGAYVHWYTRHGCEEEVFQHAFSTMETICDSYAHLCAD